MQRVNNVIPNKLCRLTSFLHHACEEFESIAKRIRDKNIRMSIRNIALKTKQYESELHSQLHMLRIKCAVRKISNTKEKDRKYVKNISDKRIIEVCCKGEAFFSNAYNSILNEPISLKPLRDMLRYQIREIYAAFGQLRLLNSVIPKEIIEEAVI